MFEFNNICSIFTIFVLAQKFHIKDNIAINPKYKTEFTEHTSETKIKHLGNAWSSVVYAMLGIYLLNTSSTNRPLSRSIEGALLIWFSWLSFRYHATEIDWIGALDITLVIHLCISCLTHSIGFTDINCILISWSILLYFLSNVYHNRDNPSESITVKHMMDIVTTLVILLMWYQIGYWTRFIMFGLGFILKKMDRIIASNGFELGVINGTSLFHVLTCIAMFMHYDYFL
jgi:hypothetical protein